MCDHIISKSLYICLFNNNIKIAIFGSFKNKLNGKLKNQHEVCKKNLKQIINTFFLSKTKICDPSANGKPQNYTILFLENT